MQVDNVLLQSNERGQEHVAARALCRKFGVRLHMGAGDVRLQWRTLRKRLLAQSAAKRLLPTVLYLVPCQSAVRVEFAGALVVVTLEPRRLRMSQHVLFHIRTSNILLTNLTALSKLVLRRSPYRLRVSVRLLYECMRPCRLRAIFCNVSARLLYEWKKERF